MNRQNLGADRLLLFCLLTLWIGLTLPIGAAQNARASPSVNAGERLFGQSCATCHNAHSKERIVGPGLKGYYTSLRPEARDETIRDIITHGRGTMPAFSALNSTEIDELISYIRNL